MRFKQELVSTSLMLMAEVFGCYLGVRSEASHIRLNFSICMPFAFAAHSHHSSRSSKASKSTGKEDRTPRLTVANSSGCYPAQSETIGVSLQLQVPADRPTMVNKSLSCNIDARLRFHLLGCNTDLYDITLPQFIGTSMVPSPGALVKLSFVQHEVAYKGRARSHETQRVGHESGTTLDVPHTDDEMDNVATGKGELHKHSGLPINASHGTEMSNRDPYELDDLRTSEVKPLQEPINDIWKDEMIFLLLLVSLTVSVRSSCNGW